MRKTVILFAVYFLLSASVSAQSVDILWQGEGYAPPFYKGRTIWSHQSSITLAAIPQGLGAASNLNYQWTRNGTILGNISGIGQSSITFLDSVLSRAQTIKVEILSEEEDVLAKSSITVTPSAPNVLVYENSPLYGFMFHREVSGNFLLKDAEVTFTAFPMFFNTGSRSNPNLRYSWQTNAGETETKSSVTYRVPEGERGSSSVNLSLSNTDSILQMANKKFLVKFGEENE